MEIHETHISLLQRAQRGDEPAWQNLADLYRPFIVAWAARHTLTREDAEDLSQEILLRVFRSLPGFEHNGRTGAFRTWLRTVAVHCTHDYRSRHQRGPRGTGDSDIQASLLQFEDPSSPLARAWDTEHDTFVLNRLMEQVRGEFEPPTLRAFQRQALEGAAAENVAAELQMSVAAVYTAKSRVLQRMRQLSEGLVDWDQE